jgi:hypothetical protein
MHTAAEAGSEEVMQFLLQTYPKMLVQKDFLQEGPLHKAAKAFHTKIYKAMTKTCLEKGYDTPMERNIQVL